MNRAIYIGAEQQSVHNPGAILRYGMTGKMYSDGSFVSERMFFSDDQPFAMDKETGNPLPWVASPEYFYYPNA